LVKLPGVESVALNFGVMTDEQRAALREKLHGSPAATAGSTPAQGHAQGRAIPFAQPGSRTRPLLISSGKGGVGKSSVTTNLAVALAAAGHSVGVVDADIYGYSIPRMLGADREPTVIDQMLLPPEAYGVRCISIGYFVPEGQAVVWRGPMLHKALEQFLTDVFWDEPDFLLIDMPPGTGDIALSLSQYLPRAEVYVVTTPQEAAQKVARLSAAMAAKVNMKVRGVIENMSWFTGDDGKRYELFGSGGGRLLADELDVPLLAQIPLTNQLREGGDVGRPIAAVAPDSESGRIFADLARRIAEDLRPKKVFSSALKVN
jgi:ATP-binding protein involved in chromosome partitioning